MDSYKKRLNNLTELIKSSCSALIAFSGGVDSTLLSFLATQILGKNALIVTVNSEFFAKNELDESVSIAGEFGFNHKIIDVKILNNPDVKANSPLRCKFCKEAIITNLQKLAVEFGTENILEGSNLDDLSDYRPGFEAVKIMGVKSPFIEAGFTKQDIREASKAYGLPNWDKPAAACLASRIPYGIEILPEALMQIEESELFIKNLGFKGIRVRHHGDTARIELDKKDIAKFISKNTDETVLQLKKLGYKYVCLDLDGYRTGSLNEADRKEYLNV